MVTPQEIEQIIQSVGHHKRERPFSPITVAKLLSNIDNEETFVDIASRAGLKDISILKSLRALNRLPEEVQDIVVWGSKAGKMSFSAASVLTSLKNEQQVKQLANMAVENAFSKTKLRKICQHLRAGRTLEESVQPD